MRLPVIRGLIRRRLLVNFRVDADVMNRILCWSWMLLVCGCSHDGFQTPGRLPRGFIEHRPLHGYLDRSAYVERARRDAQKTFRDFDERRFAVGQIYYATNMRRRAVLVEFIHEDPPKFPYLGPTLSSTTGNPTMTIRYELSPSGRVVEVTRWFNSNSQFQFVADAIDDSNVR